MSMTLNFLRKEIRKEGKGEGGWLLGTHRPMGLNRDYRCTLGSLTITKSHPQKFECQWSMALALESLSL